MNKRETTLLLAGVGAPLIFASAASAGEIPRIFVKKKIAGPNDAPFVAEMDNIYILLAGTDPLTNFITAVAGLPGLINRSGAPASLRLGGNARACRIARVRRVMVDR